MKKSFSGMTEAECKKAVTDGAFRYFCQKQLPAIESKARSKEFYSLKSRADRIRNIEERIKRLEGV